jgi:hypothetical protein
MLCIDENYLKVSIILDIKVKSFCGYIKTVGLPIILDKDFVRTIFSIKTKETIPAYLKELLSDEGIKMRIINKGSKIRFDLNPPENRGGY